MKEERQFKKELREFTYRGEKYKVEVELYYYPDDPYAYTTTESDQEVWINLRTQYITRHPEVLEEFIRNFPENQLEMKDGVWNASFKSPGGTYTVTRSGSTKEESIKNLYLWIEEN